MYGITCCKSVLVGVGRVELAKCLHVSGYCADSLAVMTTRTFFGSGLCNQFS